jgi:hypothetical protein
MGFKGRTNLSEDGLLSIQFQTGKTIEKYYCSMAHLLISSSEARLGLLDKASGMSALKKCLLKRFAFPSMCLNRRGLIVLRKFAFIRNLPLLNMKMEGLCLQIQFYSVSAVFTIAFKPSRGQQPGNGKMPKNCFTYPSGICKNE